MQRRAALVREPASAKGFGIIGTISLMRTWGAWSQNSFAAAFDAVKAEVPRG